jgi:hypothetical protein
MSQASQDIKKGERKSRFVRQRNCNALRRNIPQDISLLAPPSVTLPSVTPVSKAQLPISSFFAGPVGEMSNCKERGVSFDSFGVFWEYIAMIQEP